MEINFLRNEKKLTKLEEICTVENFAFIVHENINSKLDFFPDKLHPNQKGNVFLKEILENLLMNMSDVFHKRITSLFKITIFR